jgi:hypothetical protein
LHDLGSHVAVVDWFTLGIHRRLSGAPQDPRVARGFDGLREPELVLPCPWIDLPILNHFLTPSLFDAARVSADTGLGESSGTNEQSGFGGGSFGWRLSASVVA